jgi:hypothetical protein
MALILEIRDARGHASWHRLDRFPITLGRALSNDVIVEDPYADGVHARILLDDGGSAVIVDAGTTNGLIIGGVRATDAVRLVAGIELRMGRTLLRIRSVNEPVPPALVDSQEAGLGLQPSPSPGLTSPPVAVQGDGPAARKPWASWRTWTTWVTRTAAGRVTMISATLTAVALNAWWGNTGKSSGMPVFTTLIGAGALLMLWSSIWAAATRGPDRRFHLAGHLAVASLVTLTLLGYTIADEWLVFLFPDATVLPVVSSVVLLGAVAWVVAAHLAVPGLLTPRKRWRAGFIVSGVLLLLIGMGTLLDDDEFSDVPVFAQQVKNVPLSLIPSASTEEFLAVLREVKDRADEAVATGEAIR